MDQNAAGTIAARTVDPEDTRGHDPNIEVYYVRSGVVVAFRPLGCTPEVFFRSTVSRELTDLRQSHGLPKTKLTAVTL